MHCRPMLRPGIGSFGSASVFSLSKHLPGRGGILSIADGIDRADVAELRNELIADRPLDSRARVATRSALNCPRDGPPPAGGSEGQGDATSGQACAVASASEK